MKKLVFVLVSLFSCIASFSQAPEIFVKRGAKGIYIEHTVAPKQGLFPIGRMYNVHPRHIANFNGLDFNKGLAIGQKINIPLSDTNYSTKVNRGIPLYYQTTTTENPATIEALYSVGIDKLRGWNNLGSGAVPANTKLLVGFLITKELQDRVVTITPKASVVEESVSNVKKQESAEKKPPVPEVKKDVLIEESVSNVKKAEELKKTVDPEVKKEEPPVVKEETKKTEPVIVKQADTRNEDGAGYFRSNFYSQLKISPLSKEQTVTSSIFKTQSGWQDAKYYLLVNGVEPGTIVKITNPSNNRSVFAKVLYPMDKIRENQGVDIRISDAAASSLAVSETDKFILKLNY